MHSFLKGMDFARSFKRTFYQTAIEWYGHKAIKDAKVELVMLDPKKGRATIDVTMPDYVMNGGIE